MICDVTYTYAEDGVQPVTVTRGLDGLESVVPPFLAQAAASMDYGDSLSYVSERGLYTVTIKAQPLET